MSKSPRLVVFTCAPNFETQKFLSLKQKRATEAGIVVEVIILPATVTTTEVIQAIVASGYEAEGIIVQLPFPQTVDITSVLKNIPTTHDVDVLQYNGEETDILPPVVGAIEAIANKYQVDWRDKKVVVVGQGRLVGAPAALYATHKGAAVTVLQKDTLDYEHKIREADILILGAGVPGLINADMVKPGVMVFDAGTSEEGGMLVGDASENVADIATFLTPVPGGIGPITIAVLLKNVLQLAIVHSKREENML